MTKVHTEKNESKIEVDGLELVINGDGEPRIRDIDLAEKLGYDRPRKIRDLIKSMIATKKLNESDVRPVVGRTKIGVAERDVEEFWLTEEQALFVCAKSETEIATDILKAVIHVFVLARKGLLQEAAIAAQDRDPIWQRSAAFRLMAGLFPDPVYRALLKPNEYQARAYGLHTISNWVEEGIRLRELYSKGRLIHDVGVKS